MSTTSNQIDPDVSRFLDRLVASQFPDEIDAFALAKAELRDDASTAGLEAPGHGGAPYEFGELAKDILACVPAAIATLKALRELRELYRARHNLRNQEEINSAVEQAVKVWKRRLIENGLKEPKADLIARSNAYDILVLLAKR